MEWEDLTVFFRSESGRLAVVGGAGMRYHSWLLFDLKPSQ